MVEQSGVLSDAQVISEEQAHRSSALWSPIVPDDRPVFVEYDGTVVFTSLSVTPASG